MGFCDCGNESSVHNKIIDNERRIFPASIYIACHVLWHELSTDCVYCLCAYVSKRRLDETSDVCDQSTHSLLHTYLIHMKCYINISHIPIPSFTCYWRRNTQHIAYMRRHSISAHHLYSQYYQLISSKVFVLKLPDLIILSLYQYYFASEITFLRVTYILI